MVPELLTLKGPGPRNAIPWATPPISPALLMMTALVGTIPLDPKPPPGAPTVMVDVAGLPGSRPIPTPDDVQKIEPLTVTVQALVFASSAPCAPGPVVIRKAPASTI